MATGKLMLLTALLVCGQTSDEIVPLNQRKISFPIEIKPARRQEISQLVLYVSSDRGRSWNQQTVISPEQNEFTYTAPEDGEYWLRVATINQQGKQEPPNIYQGRPDQKIVVDTVAPRVRITSAERQGDDIAIGWDIEEEHPDLATLQVEYRTPDMPEGTWERTTVSPALTGQGRIRVAGGKPVQVRVAVKDAAKNASQAEAAVAAGPAVTTTSFSATAAPPVSAPLPAGPGVLATSPPVPQPLPAVPPAPAAPPTQELSHLAPEPPAPGRYQIEGKLVASSDATPAGVVPSPVAAPTVSRDLPPPQIVNSRVVPLEYKLAKVGPTGLGKVELWLTDNDGRTWRRYADEESVASLREGNYTRRIELPPGDGVYGLRLVVLSKAGLGIQPPRDGDVPDKRVEVDLTPPKAKLFAEPAVDEENTLVLGWDYTDKNPADLPITLEWAEHREGPWKLIRTGLPQQPNSYHWKLTGDLPVYVYLRLRARDKAGNEALAVTSEPQLVDLSRPVGQLLGVKTGGR